MSESCPSRTVCRTRDILAFLYGETTKYAKKTITNRPKIGHINTNKKSCIIDKTCCVIFVSYIVVKCRH